MRANPFSLLLLASAALALPTQRAEAQGTLCTNYIELRCLDSVGAGAANPFDREGCEEQIAEYKQCLMDLATSDAETAPGREAAAPSDDGENEEAKKAYDLVKDSGDPQKLMIVATMFPDTFYGKLAQVEALELASAKAREPDAGRVQQTVPVEARLRQPTPPPAPTRLVDVVDVPANDTLTLRSGPSRHTDALAEIPRDFRGLEWHECRDVADAKRPWCRVSYGSTTGWVYSRYITSPR